MQIGDRFSLEWHDFAELPAGLLYEVLRFLQAIFVVEQHLTLVRRVSQRVVLLSKGSVLGDVAADDMDTPAFQAKLAL